jgi:GNAT superfamily N-acetyltransferase
MSDITPAIIGDLNRLLPQLSPDIKPVSSDWVEGMFQHGVRIFVARSLDKVIGVTLLSPMIILAGRKDWIEDVVVDKEFRRRGIASQLMDMAEEASRKSHAKSINLTSSSYRDDARKMYEKRGYKLRDSHLFRLTF